VSPAIHPHGPSSAQPAESHVFAGLRAPVSVVVCTYNDEKVLGGCLATCAWCDDIHVVDFGSSDRTCEIAREMGATIHRFPPTTGKSPDRDREPTPKDLPLKHPWRFRLNADERFTPELVVRLSGLIAKGPAEPSFGVPAKVMFMERWLKRAAGSRSFQTRLVDTHRSAPGDAGAPAGRLDTPYLHYPFARGFHLWLENCNRRSSTDAGAMFKAMGAGLRVDPGLAPRNPWWTFFRTAFFRLGVLDGPPGLTYSILRAFRDHQVKLKLEELKARGGATPEYEPYSMPAPPAGAGLEEAAP
jgi:hypothetical protein